MTAKKKLQNKNNNTDLSNLKDNHLSIQISLDGFSFCVINKSSQEITIVSHINFTEKSTTPQKHLENVIQTYNKEKLLQNKYDSVNISHINDLSTQVPKPLFDEAYLKNYLQYSSKVFDNDYIVYDEIANHDIINVYIPFVNINNFFIEKFGSFEFKHSATIFIQNLLKTYKFSENPHMFAHIYNDSFEIVVIINGKLMFHNAFHHQTKEDFLYYILFTAEQLKLNPEKFELVLSGNITNESDYFKLAYKYIRKVSLIENRFNYTFDTNISEKTKRQFYTLLNQY